jgi:hypothetical protein
MENEIYVTIPTGNPDDPYRRVTLQQMADAISGVVWDLKSDIAALRAESASEPVVTIGDGSPEHPERIVPVREAIACLAENLVALEDHVQGVVDRIGAADSNFKLIANKLHTATTTARALMSYKTPPKEVN